MVMKIKISDVGELTKLIKEHLEDVINKGGNAVAEIECANYKETYIVAMVIREMHLELLSKKITPIIKLNTGMEPTAVFETALLMKSYAIATEKLQKFHPKLKTAQIREAISMEAIDELKGKTPQEITEDLKVTFPESKHLFN